MQKHHVKYSIKVSHTYQFVKVTWSNTVLTPKITFLARRLVVK
jgi:hypothetical protein